jgi:hypothetical protein
MMSRCIHGMALLLSLQTRRILEPRHTVLRGILMEVIWLLQEITQRMMS